MHRAQPSNIDSCDVGSPSASPAHSRRHSSSTHMPARFLRKRTVPSSPASLVNPASRASDVSTGARSSMPTSDHVPELMNAHTSAGAAGTAATAAAVSCAHVARITGGSPAPVGMSSGSIGPSTVPGGTISGHRSSSSPIAASRSTAHAPVRASTSCVVLAFVASATILPERRYRKYSAMSSRFAVSHTRPGSSWMSAITCGSVLIGRNWMPVRSYSVSAPPPIWIAVSTRPAVRGSR